MAVAVVDYRLSVKDDQGLPKHIHPVHVQDVNAALAFLHVRDDVPRKDWVVVGHSIGAWLTLAAIISGSSSSPDAQYPAPMPIPNSAARDSIKTCVLVPAARRSHHSEGKCPQTMLDASIPKTNCSAGDSTNQGAHDDLLHTETFWNLILAL
ncbi:hypothetical protein L1887_58077 [Cichorium endivia]|nr:hypothetical protein L1887_58077 [Cichorium endivia]